VHLDFFTACNDASSVANITVLNMSGHSSI
jgi:hypothetical protein